jgi:hypothetical protein
MKIHTNKKHTEEHYLKNGNKTQNQFANNSFNTTIKKPGINESGIEAKKDGWQP